MPRQNPTNLYFIALIPRKDIYDSIIGFKTDFALRFNSKIALKVIPHITLKNPFTLDTSDHEKLIQWFQKLSIDLTTFGISLNNFGAFQSPVSPVIFVQPVMNTPLYTLQKEIIRSFKNSFPSLIHSYDLKFKPHMTVAYRDLVPAKFKEAWKEYSEKEYKTVFEVDSFYLLQHDTKKWNILETYLLKKVSDL